MEVSHARLCACDLGYNRVKEILITVYNIPRNHLESIPHIEGALLITGIVTKGTLIIVQAAPRNQEQLNWVVFLKDILREDFLSVQAVLKNKEENGFVIRYDDVLLETLESG